MLERTEIEWKNVRKNGTVAVGTQQLGRHEVEWIITKSAGGLAHQLHIDVVTHVPCGTRATIEGCKELARDYF